MANDYRDWTESFKSAVSVAGTGNTTLITIDCRGKEQIYVELQPVTQNLDAFIVAARPHADGTFNTLYSVAADFTSPAGLIIGASGDLTTLAAGATGWFIMDVSSLRDVRLSASAAADSSAVTVYVGGQ